MAGRIDSRPFFHQNSHKLQGQIANVLIKNAHQDILFGIRLYHRAFQKQFQFLRIDNDILNLLGILFHVLNRSPFLRQAEEGFCISFGCTWIRHQSISSMVIRQSVGLQAPFARPSTLISLSTIFPQFPKTMCPLLLSILQ